VLELRRGADIIIATPGRLLDLLADAPAPILLQRLKFMVSPAAAYW
jgi:superfamily II DNA/RNA helicase